MKFINMLIVGLFLTTLVACGGNDKTNPDPIDISLANGIWVGEIDGDTILAYFHNGQIMSLLLDGEDRLAYYDLFDGTYTFQTEDILTGTINTYEAVAFPPFIAAIEDRNLSLVGELGVDNEGNPTLTMTVGDEDTVVFEYSSIFDVPISQNTLSGLYQSDQTDIPFVVDDDGRFYGQTEFCIVSGEIRNISNQTNMANIEYTYQCDILGLDGTYNGLSAFINSNTVFAFMQKNAGQDANNLMLWDVFTFARMD